MHLAPIAHERRLRAEVRTHRGAQAVGTESAVAVYRRCQETVGPEASVRRGSPGALENGASERMDGAPQTDTFGDGVSEALRETVVTMRLGTARERR